MKKINKFLSIFAFAALLFTSCEVGLGPGVDMQAPVVTLESHRDNDSVASTFRLVGTASDNEKVTKISIDFDEKDIHFYVTNGGKWHKKTSTTDWTELDDSKAGLSYNNTTINWWVDVDTTDGATSGDTYIFSIIAQDHMNNAGKDSKVDCALIVDEKLPSASVIKPELFSTASVDMNKYKLEDPNIISLLNNGTLTLNGRVDGAISTKELLIQFDNGTTFNTLTDFGDEDTTAAAIAQANDFAASKVYYSLTLKTGQNNISDLRAWNISVKPQDWISDTNNPELKTGEHLIRVVATSVSKACAYERKVLGWFIWYPEADRPWLKLNSGADTFAQINTAQTYPSSAITGQAYDDDGILTLTYTIQKQVGQTSSFADVPEYKDLQIELSEALTKSTAFSVTSPSDVGKYKIILKVTDMYGSSSQEEKYFEIMDVSAPKITIEKPENEKSVFDVSEKNGNIPFTIKLSDDGQITTLKMVYLNPEKANDAANKVKYMTSTQTDWDIATKNGAEDTNKNIVYNLTSLLGTPVFENKTYNYSIGEDKLKLNLFTLLGNDKKLAEQNFIFLVTDNGGTSTIQSISLTGDTQAPDLAVTKIKLCQQKGNDPAPSTDIQIWPASGWFDMTGDAIPNFPVIKDKYYAVIEGNWSDNSITKWQDKDKISAITVNWEKNITTAKKTLNPSTGQGTWSAICTTGLSSGRIIVSITDLGKNTKTVTKSIFVETTSAALDRIGADTDDGTYKKDSEIEITMEFTKNTSFTGTGTPSLKLNNGKTADYKEGIGTAKHVFTYAVGKNDEKGGTYSTDGKLLVTEINMTNVTWTDAASGEPFDVLLPTDTKKTLASRNIKIDTTAPKVESITAISQDGNYKAGAQLIFMLKFTEPVSVDYPKDQQGNVPGKLQIKFKHKKGSENVLSAAGVSSGSEYILFTHTVSAGENTSTNGLEFDSIDVTGTVEVKDEAKNPLTSWTSETTPDFSGITIDTTAPKKLTINPAWTSGTNVCLDDNGTSFTISGIEPDAVVEYTLDGSNYLNYNGKVTDKINNGEVTDRISDPIPLTNNKTYTINARQTDAAGNTEISDTKTITVNKGALLTKLSATIVSGTYSTQTTTNSVQGYIEFRTPVVIESGATVSVNVKNNKNTPDNTSDDEEAEPIALKLPSGDPADGNTASTIYNFTYTIAEGDYIDEDAVFDVTGWSFDTVKLDGKDVPMTFASVPDAKKFTAFRQIYIKTGTLTASPSWENDVLTITYNKPVSKNSAAGNITFEMEESDFKIPTVLTVEEYNQLPDSIKAANVYKEGVNGATTYTKDSKTYLQNDTTTKYILDYSKNEDDATIKELFITANMHKVTIPLYSSAVKVSGSTLTLSLGSLYKLPVKGASYTLTIPAGAVQDSLNYTSEELTQNVTAQGIETPVIRMQKTASSIGGITNTSSGDYTKTATVTMPQTAKFKIDCRTPGVTLFYKTNPVESTAVTVTRANHMYTTKTATESEVKEPDTSDNNDKYTGEQTLASGDGYKVNTYADAKGLKIAITATAEKNGVTVSSYEYAARTVIKFKIDGNYSGDGNGTKTDFDGILTGKNLTFVDLRVYLAGGDSPYGANSITGFPLSWNDSSNFKLMAGKHSTGTGNADNVSYMYGEWWWVSWDISAPTYHGFYIGDVPYDAAENGPSIWFAAECGWVPTKENYILYPGETLIMYVTAPPNDDRNANGPAFHFRPKNIATR